MDELSWYIISVDVVIAVWNIPLRAPLLILIEVCSQSGQNTVFRWHSWPLQTNALHTRPAFASPGRACISNMYYLGNERITPGQQGRITLSCIPSWYAWSSGVCLIQHAQTGGWEEWVGGSCILSEDLWSVLWEYPGIHLLVQMTLVLLKGTFSDVMMQHCDRNAGPLSRTYHWKYHSTYHMRQSHTLLNLNLPPP